MAPTDHIAHPPAEPTDPADAIREKRRVALSSVAAAVLLTGGKLAVGLLTGSLGLLAEAAHSGLDLVAAIITWFAVRVSDKPADAEHLYGHGKVENLSALVETLLLLITCAWIVSEAVQRLFFKVVSVEATIWSFAVIIGSIVVDVSRSRALLRVARKYNSQALEADALHFRTDVWSSGVVLLGLVLVRIGENSPHAATLERADAVAALVVALLVIGVSYRLGRRTIDALLDRAPAGTAEAVTRALRDVPGVLACRRLRLRSSGNRMFVDVVIGARRGQSLESGHAIGSAVEQRVRSVLPEADVVVHIDPLSGAAETLVDRIRAIAVNEGQTVHNIAITEEGGRLFVELHVEADEHLDLQEAHARSQALEDALRAEWPQIATVTAHIEPARHGHEPLRDVTRDSSALVQRVRQIAAATPGVVECHDVAVRQAGREVYLTMHATFAAGLAVRDVHEISSQLERSLRREIPDLVRVTTHPEPFVREPGDTTTGDD